MGFFSWLTSDTKKSIANQSSSRPVFTVYMITEDGRSWREDAYEGYGVFGGKDIYELIAEMNGLSAGGTFDDLRGSGIDLVFQDNPGGDFSIAAEKGVKLPKLVESSNVKFADVPYPECCEEQGFFYSDEEEDDDFDSWAEEEYEYDEDED